MDDVARRVTIAVFGSFGLPAGRVAVICWFTDGFFHICIVITQTALFTNHYRDDAAEHGL
jgi:hypothetical protein